VVSVDAHFFDSLACCSGLATDYAGGDGNGDPAIPLPVLVRLSGSTGNVLDLIFHVFSRDIFDG